MLNKNITEELKGFFFMVIGSFAYALSTSLLLAPNSIVAGGMAGLAVLFHLFNENIPIGLMTLALNIPIFTNSTIKNPLLKQQKDRLG